MKAILLNEENELNEINTTEYEVIFIIKDEDTLYISKNSIKREDEGQEVGVGSVDEYVKYLEAIKKIKGVEDEKTTEETTKDEDNRFERYVDDLTIKARIEKLKLIKKVAIAEGVYTDRFIENVDEKINYLKSNVKTDELKDISETVQGLFGAMFDTLDEIFDGRK